MDDEWVFRNYYTSEWYGNLSTNRDHERIDSIIAASKIRNDTLHNTLSPLLAENENLKIHYHNKCGSKYCSPKSLVEKAPPAKRQRRSDVALFNFKTQCLYCTSDTLQELLEYISSKFRNSLNGVITGNIVTSIVQYCSTPLMLALGNLLRTSKILLNHFYDYRVTCTHDGILRFKKSAAVNQQMLPICLFAYLPNCLIAYLPICLFAYLPGVPGNNDLLQVITDNYDAIMHLHNYKLLCHCLAIILTRNGDRPSSGIKFPRLKKIDMLKPIDEANSVEISTYVGPKKPPMPAYVRKSLSEDFIRRQTVSRERRKYWFSILCWYICK